MGRKETNHILNLQVGARIRALREKLGMSRKELSERCLLYTSGQLGQSAVKQAGKRTDEVAAAGHNQGKNGEMCIRDSPRR